MSDSATSGTATVLPPAHVPSHGYGRIHPWQKGQSGNPTGKLGEYHAVRRLCADHSIEGAKQLIALMHDTDTRVAIVAIKEVLDRGIGKPRDHSNEQGGKIDLSALSAEEREAMAKLLAKAMGL